MVEGEPEVQHDGANDGVQEGAVVGVPIRELHHLVQAVGQLFRRRRKVEHLVVGVADLYAFVLRPLQTPGRGRIAQGVRRQRDVQGEHRLGGQRRVLHRADRLHGAVVVQDHLLAAVPGVSSCANHPRRGGPRRGGALELARRDGFLYQRVDNEPISRLPVGHRVLHPNPAAGPAVDSVQGLLDGIGQHEAERPSTRVTQRDLTKQAASGQLDSRPPFLAAQVPGRIEPAQRVPVKITAVDRRAEGVA